MRRKRPYQSEESKQRTVSILPPEGVPLRFVIAPVSSRFSALAFDLLLITISMYLMVFVLIAIFVAGGLFKSGGGYALSFWLIGIFLIRQCYFFFFEMIWQGSTPGKKLLGLRVIARDGRPLGLQGLIARNLMRDIEVFIPLGLFSQAFQMGNESAWLSWMAMGWCLIALTFPFFHPQSMRIGDIVGGTFVIVIPKAELEVDKARQTTLARKVQISFTPEQLAVYGEYELETLAQLLRKVDEDKADADDLRIIARTIADKIRYEGHEPLSTPLVFLQIFYAAQRKALEQKLIWGQRKANKHQRS
ncbi:RDD family protein [Myxococcota bacterium]|nr:RDD family protein [Myxococcota bacterium]